MTTAADPTAIQPEAPVWLELDAIIDASLRRRIASCADLVETQLAGDLGMLVSVIADVTHDAVTALGRAQLPGDRYAQAEKSIGFTRLFDLCALISVALHIGDVSQTYDKELRETYPELAARLGLRAGRGQ